MRTRLNAHKYERIIKSMNGTQFIQKVRKLGRKNGVAVNFNKAHGKGSHGTVFFSANKSTVKDRKKEIRAGLLAAMCKQLGIKPGDL
jgi:mRNA interferase HicA